MSQYNTGILYLEGRGVQQSYEQAAEYFLLAAEQGNIDAMYNLGIMYDQGLGVEQSCEQAAEYFRLAAAQGNASAQYNLGVYYCQGTGVEQSYEQAAEYFRLAAEQGEVRALYDLGVLYDEGMGVEQSGEQAAEYYRLAAAQGYADAQTRLDALEAKAASEAVAGEDPLLAEAVAAGMHLPEPGDGERLYLGVGEVQGTQQTKLYLAFLLLPDGRSIRWMDLFAEALEVVKDDDGEIHLINSETSTHKDAEISLSPDVTNLTFDADTGMGVFDLRFDGDSATCRMVVAGRCEQPEDSVNGSYRAEAELTLRNLSGEAAREAIDPPTLEQAEEMGMRLPEPETGEALYLGAANVSQAEALYVAFVVTADGQGLRGLTTLVQNMDVTYSTDGKTTHVTSSSQGTDVSGTTEITADMSFGSIRLSGFTLDGDTASAVLHYAYHATSDNLDVPFDPARVAFVSEKG